MYSRRTWVTLNITARESVSSMPATSSGMTMAGSSVPSRVT